MRKCDRNRAKKVSLKPISGVACELSWCSNSSVAFHWKVSSESFHQANDSLPLNFATWIELASSRNLNEEAHACNRLTRTHFISPNEFISCNHSHQCRRCLSLWSAPFGVAFRTLFFFPEIPLFVLSDHTAALASLPSLRPLPTRVLCRSPDSLDSLDPFESFSMKDTLIRPVFYPANLDLSSSGRSCANEHRALSWFVGSAPWSPISRSGSLHLLTVNFAVCKVYGETVERKSSPDLGN